MTEIRLQWKTEITHYREDILNFGVWHERTAASARDLDLMVKAGEQVYGAVSHWVETREQPENHYYRA